MCTGVFVVYVHGCINTVYIRVCAHAYIRSVSCSIIVYLIPVCALGTLLVLLLYSARAIGTTAMLRLLCDF